MPANDRRLFPMPYGPMSSIDLNRIYAIKNTGIKSNQPWPCLTIEHYNWMAPSRRATSWRKAGRMRSGRWKERGSNRSAWPSARRRRSGRRRLESRMEVEQITGRMLEDFTRLLSSLLAAGISLSRALVILHRGFFAEPVKSGGKCMIGSWTGCRWRMPWRSRPMFSARLCRDGAGGEAGGFLNVVLAQIADFQARKRNALENADGHALPGDSVGAGFGVLVFLLVFFIPRFQLILPASARRCLC